MVNPRYSLLSELLPVADCNVFSFNLYHLGSKFSVTYKQNNLDSYVAPWPGFLLNSSFEEKKANYKFSDVSLGFSGLWSSETFAHSRILTTPA